MEKKKKEIVETTFAMFDVSKVQSVMIGCTIPLATPYSNIRLEVTGDDPETCRRAIIETLGNIIPFKNEADRLCIAAYLKNVLVKER